MDLDARTDALFANFAADDADGVAELCAPGFRIKQNNGPEVDVGTLTDGLRAMLWDAGIKTAYSDVRRTVADHVVTEQHVVTLTRSDGFSSSSDVCAVIRFDDNGLITRIDEYFDSAAFGSLLS